MISDVTSTGCAGEVFIAVTVAVTVFAGASLAETVTVTAGVADSEEPTNVGPARLPAQGQELGLGRGRRWAR